MASTSGPASAEEAALSSLNSHSSDELQMAEEGLRDVLMAKVQALAAEHGEAFIQSLIQKEISRTKKMETELATVKKKLGAEERAVDELRLEVRKVKVQGEKSKHICHGLQETVKKREQLMEEMGAEMEKYRSSIRDRVTENVQNMLADCEKRRESVEATEAEVAELEATLEHQKQTFEQSFADFQNGLKGHTEEYQGLINSYQESAKQVELLEARLMLVRREYNSSEMTRASLYQQLEVYEKQFQGFADSVMRPEDVEALAKRQSEQAQLRIAQMEADKANVHQQRLQMDKELTDLRAKHASLKRTMQQLEKVKAAAEKKCRLAQQSLQEKK